jgi:hypothetical protein
LCRQWDREPRCGPDAVVNGCEHIVCALDGPANLVFCSAVVELSGLDEIPDQVAQGRVAAQIVGILLADDLVLGEGVFYAGNDEGLGAKVANCDGRRVALAQGALGVARVDALCEDGGALDGQQGNVEFLLIGHGGGV